MKNMMSEEILWDRMWLLLRLLLRGLLLRLLLRRPLLRSGAFRLGTRRWLQLASACSCGLLLLLLLLLLLPPPPPR